MLILGTKNTTIKDLAIDELLDFGTVYRRYDKKGQCGCRAFEVNGATVTLQQPGIYHLTAVITFTAPAAGDVTFQLYENGFPNPNAIVTTSATTADTEVNTVVMDVYVLVDNTNVLNSVSALKNITISNTGVASTVSNVVVNIDKVV